VGELRPALIWPAGASPGGPDRRGGGQPRRPWGSRPASRTRPKSAESRCSGSIRSAVSTAALASPGGRSGVGLGSGRSWGLPAGLWPGRGGSV